MLCIIMHVWLFNPLETICKYNKLTLDIQTDETNSFHNSHRPPLKHNNFIEMVQKLHMIQFKITGKTQESGNNPQRHSGFITSIHYIPTRTTSRKRGNEAISLDEKLMSIHQRRQRQRLCSHCLLHTFCCRTSMQDKVLLLLPASLNVPPPLSSHMWCSRFDFSRDAPLSAAYFSQFATRWSQLQRVLIFYLLF